MCLAVPAKLIKASRLVGVADLHGSKVPVSLALVPEAQAGDWVLIHAGFALKQIKEGEVQETFRLVRRLEGKDGGDGEGGSS